MPSLTPTPAMFLLLVTLTFDLLTSKYMSFPDSSLNISVSSLGILAASVFETSCGKIDTNKWRQKHYLATAIGMGKYRLLQTGFTNVSVLKWFAEKNLVDKTAVKLLYSCHSNIQVTKYKFWSPVKEIWLANLYWKLNTLVDLNCSRGLTS